MSERDVNINVNINLFGPFGQDGISSILGQLGDIKSALGAIMAGETVIIQQESMMQQSTTDLDAVVQALGDTVNNQILPGLASVGSAIDAIVAAQGSGDAAEVEAQVASLSALKDSLTGSLTTLQGHLPTVAAAAQAAAQAPADPNASISAPAAASA